LAQVDVMSTAYGKSCKGRQPDVFAGGVCIMVSSTMPMALYHLLNHGTYFSAL
jgi:hypothetical protein